MSNAPEYGHGEGTLTRAAGMVADAHKDFRTIATRLDDQIKAISGKWVGQGGNAFQILNEAWQEKQSIINNALTNFEESLKGTETDNMATDDDQNVRYTNLTNRLG